MIGKASVIIDKHLRVFLSNFNCVGWEYEL